MEQARMTVHQLRQEANINRKKVSDVAKDLIDFCETKKNEDRLMTGPIGPNPFQEKKSCSLL
ncbi:Guanine nucleotide-binding protein subunit gamma [Meloidogyne graminicola]|uniref:Guanine nucleotide-binding protein subunit gamma n=1 Tax=Meloidogyne graminicola TaxID=189291 RepID=A0A8T0A0Z6_9BILA|nr:Guanine nucleotide-binding protein subunit gamma [Meloidogyne graminicola]